MENRDLADTAYKSRKRVSGVINIENYKHNKIKKAKIAGKAHKNHKGRDVVPRQTGAYCRCKLKCMKTISEDNIQSSICFINNFDSKNVQDTYLQALIEKQEIHRKRPKSEVPKNRQFTFKYHIKIEGGKLEVCKKAFSSIHGISEKQVRRLCILLKTNEQPIDHRGKSQGSRSNAISGDTLSKIWEHTE
ncbi:unnamed protein product [Psylliodes chrysocephalus]|uniref:Uncharacterized protein n=1 Tax=Psylliodes chrysocephalus TaxID=3402493 RepID=A0A9P0GD22_9CUCU|nr:unnamed protein product [Psylliodes chrysocephala]